MFHSERLIKHKIRTNQLQLEKALAYINYRQGLLTLYEITGIRIKNTIILVANHENPRLFIV